MYCIYFHCAVAGVPWLKKNNMKKLFVRSTNDTILFVYPYILYRFNL